VFNSEHTTSLFYRMIARLSAMSTEASPTSFHELLKLLDERGQLLRVYTQNIDTLEEKAGLSFGLPELVTKREGPSKGKGKRVEADLAKAPANPEWTSSCSALTPSSSSSSLASSESSTPVPTPAPIVPSPTPRCIPLHGTLQSLICHHCTYTVPVSQHLPLLAKGDHVACPQCEANNAARRRDGKRERPLGRMRPSVVLYGETHNDGEDVGECVRRDLFGGAGRGKARDRPDLVIVAGTSLRIPGTKRIVREFAKAVQTIGNPASTKRKGSDTEELPTPAPTPTASRDKGKARAAPDMESSESDVEIDDELLELHDGTPPASRRSSSRPPPSTSTTESSRFPKTIYLNLDFPMPARDWDGVFDSWVQGDVQKWADGVKEMLVEEDKRVLAEQERKEKEKEKRRLEKEEREKRALEKEAEKREMEKREMEKKKALEKATTPKKRKGTKSVTTEEGAPTPPTKKPRSSAPIIIRIPKSASKARQDGAAEDIEMASTAKKARPPKKLKPSVAVLHPPAKQKPPSASAKPSRPLSARSQTLRRYSSLPTLIPEVV